MVDDVPHESVRFIPSTKRKPQAVLKGKIHTQHDIKQLKDGTTARYWSCAKDKTCGGKIITYHAETKDDECTEASVQSFKEKKPHSCFTSESDVTHQEGRAKIIEEVSSGRGRKTSDVHQEVQAGMQMKAAATFICTLLLFFVPYMYIF